MKAQPGLLYFQVEAQRSVCLKVPEPITLFRMPLRMPPAVLAVVLLDELLLDEPPSKPPKMPATVDAAPVLLVDVAVLAVDGVVVAVVVVVVVAAVDFVVVVFFEVFFVFFVVFFTGQFVVCESDASLSSFARLPAVQASTRAAVRNTFFIVFLYF